MKKTIIFTSVAIATLFAFSSCQKENLENNGPENSLRIITAEFENNATKTTLNDKTPEWAEGDVIRILSSSTYKDITLETGSGTPAEGKGYIDNNAIVIAIPAAMTGTLYAVYPASATALESCSDGNVAFTIPSTQDGTFASANICVAKGNDKDNLIFRNATAVLKITTAADVVGVDITATNSIAGSVTASFSGDGISLTPNLTGKTVSAVCKSAPSGNVFYLATAPGSTGSTTATCYSIDKKGSTDKGDKELLRNVIYAMDLSEVTPSETVDLTSTKGELNGHEFVIIRAKYDGSNDSYLKWATRNVGATDDTGTDSYGTYFAWGDTQGQNASTKTGGTSITDAFTKDFDWNNCPFAATGNPTFSKYVPDAQKSTYGKDGTFCDDKTTLEYEDDAARANWGGTWRMPIGYDATGAGEFKALKDATYWAWDVTDCGYYVFAPDGSHTAGTRVSSIPTGLDKGSALLFFPAAGVGDGTTLYDAGSSGNYWSSSLSTGYPYDAYTSYFHSDNVLPQYSSIRYSGFSVRPVSD